MRDLSKFTVRNSRDSRILKGSVGGINDPAALVM